MIRNLSRREMIACGGACLGATLAPTALSVATAGTSGSTEEPFGYCLNTATIMGRKLPLDEEIEIAAKAGYQAVEVWIRNVQRYVDQGGVTANLKKRIEDLGLSVAGAIGFPRWAVDDEAQRAEGVDEIKRGMDLVAQLDGTRIAAPPAGINRTPGVNLRRIAERYRAVLELGRQMGVVPQLEIWGSALTLGTVAEAAFVATAADHPDACLLLDAYHMYRGGSGFHCLKLLGGAAMHVFHINDYPGDRPREELTDADRVYPGDGVAPSGFILKTLHETGFRGMLSLELFNRDYWKQDPLVVARAGLEKMRAAVHKALG